MLINLYYSLIYSHIVYCIQEWGGGGGGVVQAYKAAPDGYAEPVIV